MKPVHLIGVPKNRLYVNQQIDVIAKDADMVILALNEIIEQDNLSHTPVLAKQAHHIKARIVDAQTSGTVVYLHEAIKFLRKQADWIGARGGFELT